MHLPQQLPLEMRTGRRDGEGNDFALSLISSLGCRMGSCNTAIGPWQVGMAHPVRRGEETPPCSSRAITCSNRQSSRVCQPCSPPPHTVLSFFHLASSSLDCFSSCPSEPWNGECSAGGAKRPLTKGLPQRLLWVGGGGDGAFWDADRNSPLFPRTLQISYKISFTFLKDNLSILYN